MSLVLVVSNSQDAHVPPVTGLLQAAGHHVVRFDTDRVPRGCSLSFCSSEGASQTRFSVDGSSFVASDVTSVWWRRPEPVAVSSALALEATKFVQGEWGAAIQGGMRTVDAFWVNHPEALRYARHKIVQLQLGPALGFAIPETLISADPEEVRDFYDSVDGQMIGKLVDAGPPRVEPDRLQ